MERSDDVEAEENERQLLAKGYTSHVFLIPGTNKVCKSYLQDGRAHRFAIEKEAYERFTAHGHPSSILRYYGVDEYEPAAIILELAENGSVWEYLWDHPETERTPKPEDLYKWARQAAEALEFSHSCGVLHSDIHSMNFFFDANLDLKVADFAEASIDGGSGLLFYRTTHSLPGARKASIESEIFALGSAFYFMVTGHDVYPELRQSQHGDEIKRRLRAKEFPLTDDFPVLGAVIRKCWILEYKSMTEVLDDIQRESQGPKVEVSPNGPNNDDE